MLGLIIGIIIVLLVVALLLAAIRIITQPNQGVVLTFGKFERVLSSGFHVIKPFISHVIVVNTAQTPVDLDQQVVITKDNAEISVKISLKYHVTNIEDFVFKNEDSVRSMIQDTRAALRGIIGNKELNEVLNGTQEINAALFKEISSVTAGYGLNVDRVNIDSVNPSADIQASMNKLLQATRERDATIATAEGKSRSITLENEANNQALLATNTAQNQALVNSATAKATAIQTEADADAYRMRILNEALSKSSDNYFIFQNIEAFKELANSDANTVVMPNQTIDSLGMIPALTKLGQVTTK
ncbi:SPFH domain-containing protein [Lactiplantibacillus dongliensis]|uniref:SPFH domain-containing protein n=1 Tax=Lactiplantibacillus dongliensis TaxID=2559919 RepID=A0ABW1R334_9LACO|nr:SPFH domain-containing protein [Lactiplantibacillus dongliensis]